MFHERNHDMYLDDITPGLHIQTAPVRIEYDKMLAFARDYDPLRIHTDPDYAKTTRFGQLIAPGVMSFMSVWAKVLESDIFGDELIAGKSTHIEWHKPVFADDILTGDLRVTRIERRNPYNGICETTMEVCNQNGEIVLTNVTESVVKYRTQA